MVISKIKKALESFYLIPAVFVLAVLGRVFNVINITLPLLAFIVVLILFFCDDVKNVLAIIFYAPFYIKDLNMFNMPTLYAILIASVVVALLYFTIKRIITLKRQNALIKGKLYIPLAIVTVAYLLGGVVYDFNLTNAMVILVLSMATFLLYFIALNSEKDVGTFMCKVFVIGAILVGFMVLYENYVNYGGIRYIFSRSYYSWVGAENVNVAALFILLGVFGAFSLGYKTKKDGIWLLVSVLFYLLIIVTYCRMVIGVGAVSLILLTILTLKNSPDRKRFLIYLASIIPIGIIAIILSWNVISQILSVLFNKMSFGLTGREELWPWCIEKFRQNPIFGIGFKISENVPTMGAGAAHYVLAHNVLLQWLTSLGIFGTLCMIVFTVFKYKILLKDFSSQGFIIRLLIIFIAVNSLIDQAPQMDPFIYNIVIVLIAWIERISFHCEKIKVTKNEKN